MTGQIFHVQPWFRVPFSRHANYYDFSVIITNFSLKYDITDRTEKITNFEKIIRIFCEKSSSDRPNRYVFGIIGKLFENGWEWWLIHADTLITSSLISVSNLKKKYSVKPVSSKHPWGISKLLALSSCLFITGYFAFTKILKVNITSETFFYHVWLHCNVSLLDLILI